MNHTLVYYGNETLHKAAEDVKNIDQEIIDLINNMYNIMYKYNGVGLAGPQVNESKKIITLDIRNSKVPPMTIINPEIVSLSSEIGPFEEGCLSLPGISEEIIRPLQISVKAVTPDGKEILINADGLLARALQHEIDHLNGIVFIDHLEDHIRKKLRSELKKIKKLNIA
ncbi:MAG: peptide deformylase [Spirochaetes bacterium]|nr:peptide deformylase [Spirochaetota bacterium]